jgi:hypothetical protein
MSNESTKNPAKTTPASWEGPEDARKMQGAGKYPNYWTHRTRSGHVFTLDDSKDAEHVTLQHRGGSMIQFMPDGAVHFVSHNGQYTFVFGENRVKITGAYDVTVEGGGSLKVDGDYNVTVKGKTNFSVGDDFNLTARNFNQTIRGNIDVVAKNRTEKIEGNIDQQAEGAQKITAKYGMTVKSTGDTLALGAKKQVGIHSLSDEIMMKSAKKTSLKSDEEIVVDAAGDLSLHTDDELKIESFGKTSVDANKVSIKSSDLLEMSSGTQIKAMSPGVNPGTWAKAAALSSAPTEGQADTSGPADASDAPTDTKQTAAPEVQPETPAT